MDCKTALLTILDQVDYTNGACHLTEMVGAVLPKEVIALAREAIAREPNDPCICKRELVVTGPKADCPVHGLPSIGIDLGKPGTDETVVARPKDCKGFQA